MVLEISGIVFAMLGASLSMGLAAIGSGMGVYFAGSAGAGVLAEDPTKFGQALVYDVLPQTQGVYGLLGAILIMLGTGIMGGEAPSVEVGMAALFISIFAIAFVARIGWMIVQFVWTHDALRI